MAAQLTKYGLSEQIIRMLKGSDNPAASSVKQPEVQLLIGQAVNKLISAAPLSTDSRPGTWQGIDVGAYSVATYTRTVSQAYGSYSKITLPCAPCRVLKEDKDIGLFQITKVNDPFNPFVPVPAGLYTMVSEEPLISDLLGQVGYERNGMEVLFTVDLTTATPSVSSVLVKLIVLDVSQLTDHDPLPIPADMELDIIKEVLGLLGVQAKPDNKVDAVSETKK